MAKDVTCRMLAQQTRKIEPSAFIFDAPAARSIFGCIIRRRYARIIPLATEGKAETFDPADVESFPFFSSYEFLSPSRRVYPGKHFAYDVLLSRVTPAPRHPRTLKEKHVGTRSLSTRHRRDSGLMEVCSSTTDSIRRSRPPERRHSRIQIRVGKLWGKFEMESSYGSFLFLSHLDAFRPCTFTLWTRLTDAN